MREITNIGKITTIVGRKVEYAGIMFLRNNMINMLNIKKILKLNPDKYSEFTPLLHQVVVCKIDEIDAYFGFIFEDEFNLVNAELNNNTIQYEDINIPVLNIKKIILELNDGQGKINDKKNKA
jgi:chemotaxis signal transduction protein